MTTIKKERPRGLGGAAASIEKARQEAETVKTASLLDVSILEHNKNNVRSLGFSLEDIKRWLRIGREDCLVDPSGEILVCPESLMDIPDGPRPDTDDLFYKKEEAFQKLIQMAKALHLTTIDTIPPIDVIQDPENERKLMIQRGHRRHLTHVVAGKQKIYAFIRYESLSEDNEFKLFQEAFAENKHHDGVSLDDAIRAVNRAAALLKRDNPNLTEGSHALKQKIKESLALSNHELSMLWPLRNAQNDVMTAIKLGILSSSRKAYDLTKVADPDVRIRELLKLKGGEVLIRALKLDITPEEVKELNKKEVSTSVADTAIEAAPIQEPMLLEGGVVVDASDVFNADEHNEGRYSIGVSDSTNPSIPLGFATKSILKKLVLTLLETEDFRDEKAQLLSTYNIESPKSLAAIWKQILKRSLANDN